MGVGRKPKNKHTLTIHFDTKAGIENFMAWYLDGGGEQSAGYYEEAYGKDWMYVKAPPNACPKCEFTDIYKQSDILQGTCHVICGNCTYKYLLDQGDQ